jgi:hypothetical protein
VFGRTAGCGRGVYCEPTLEGGVAGFCAVVCPGELREAESKAMEAATAYRLRKNMPTA